MEYMDEYIECLIEMEKIWDAYNERNAMRRYCMQSQKSQALEEKEKREYEQAMEMALGRSANVE